MMKYLLWLGFDIKPINPMTDDNESNFCVVRACKKIAEELQLPIDFLEDLIASIILAIPPQGYFSNPNEGEAAFADINKIFDEIYGSTTIPLQDLGVDRIRWTSCLNNHLFAYFDSCIQNKILDDKSNNDSN